MIPSWLVTALVFALGCIFSIYLGTTLPSYGYLGLYLVITSIVCWIVISCFDVPALLAIAVWFPIPTPVPVLKSLPLVAVAIGWFLFLLFFQICQSRQIGYIRSFNLLMLVGFIWVPVRFLISPIDKLGASAGGSGVSGVFAYMGYFIAAGLVFAMGAALNTREKVDKTMQWSFYTCLFVGTILFICSFIPASLPILTSLGMFIVPGDPVLRIVALPMYGLFILGAGLTPAYFRLSGFAAFCVTMLGLAMIVIGQNRSTFAGALVLIPVILFTKRSLGGFAIFGVLILFGVVAAFTVAETMTPEQAGGMGRILGIINPKLDELSGADVSAKWRYEVWTSARQKIAESPLIGKGFGNLPKTVDPDSGGGVVNSSDFEVIIAAGMEHDGYLVAAYGFGIPFAIVLVAALVLEIFTHIHTGLRIRNRDPALSDLHAFIGALLAAFLLLVYTASDLSGDLIWFYAAVGVIYNQLTKNSPGLSLEKKPAWGIKPMPAFPGGQPTLTG